MPIQLSVVLASAFLVIISIAISIVDIRTFRIPNILNIALFIAGIIFWISYDATVLPMQIIYAVIVASFFWAVRYAVSKYLGRVALGLGDVKLAGASAMWFSPHLFPVYLFVASSTGLLFALAKPMIGKSITKDGKVPFGPFLAVSLVIVWFFEQYMQRQL